VEARDVAEVGDEVKGFSVQENFLLKKKKREVAHHLVVSLSTGSVCCVLSNVTWLKKKKR
jgi:hypothetical protein